MVASVAVDGLRRSCGLAVDQRVDGAMRLVDRHVHRGRVALRNNNKINIFLWKKAHTQIDKIGVLKIEIVDKYVQTSPDHTESLQSRMDKTTSRNSPLTCLKDW